MNTLERINRDSASLKVYLDRLLQAAGIVSMFRPKHITTKELERYRELEQALKDMRDTLRT